MQSISSSAPVVSLYRPVGQSVHADTFDAVEYLPTPHAVHVVAPVFVPVFVIEPTAHTMHAATSDAVEYSPAAHAMHELAPALVPVSVREPAKHTKQ